MHGDGEQTNALALVGKNIERALYGVQAVRSPHRFPRPSFSARHIESVQFGVFRILQAQVANKLVDLFNDVVYLPLKHGDTGENEISFVGIFDGPGTVDVKQMHRASLRGGVEGRLKKDAVGWGPRPSGPVKTDSPPDHERNIRHSRSRYQTVFKRIVGKFSLPEKHHNTLINRMFLQSLRRQPRNLGVWMRLIADIASALSNTVSIDSIHLRQATRNELLTSLPSRR